MDSCCHFILLPTFVPNNRTKIHRPIRPHKTINVSLTKKANTTLQRVDLNKVQMTVTQKAPLRTTKAAYRLWLFLQREPGYIRPLLAVDCDFRFIYGGDDCVCYGVHIIDGRIMVLITSLSVSCRFNKRPMVTNVLKPSASVVFALNSTKIFIFFKLLTLRPMNDCTDGWNRTSEPFGRTGFLKQPTAPCQCLPLHHVRVFRCEKPYNARSSKTDTFIPVCRDRRLCSL